jgi:hypothetical protein
MQNFKEATPRYGVGLEEEAGSGTPGGWIPHTLVHFWYYAFSGTMCIVQLRIGLEASCCKTLLWLLHVIHLSWLVSGCVISRVITIINTERH